MEIEIQGKKIDYVTYGSGKNIILVHGWGASYDYFYDLISELSKNYCVYAINLPGFGKSEIPDFVYSTSNYSEILLEFIKKLKIDNPILIGHSFGGKVIIDLLTNRNYKVEKVVLIDSAGLKKKKTLCKRYKGFKYKILKKIIKKVYSESKASKKIEDLDNKYGSADYIASSGVMREILVSVIHEDYYAKLKYVDAKTLLIWGSEDIDTPLYHGKIMKREMKNSGLVVIDKAGHFPFITNFYQVLKVLESFIDS